MLVPEAGIEPAWGFPRGFLRPVRLPIPPLRPVQLFFVAIRGNGRNKEIHNPKEQEWQ